MSENIFDGQAHEDELINQAEWDDFVRLGIEAIQLRDKSNWTLGDLALDVETKYGAHSLKRYAEEINFSPESLKVYRWVASRYEKDNRFDGLSSGRCGPFFWNGCILSNDPIDDRRAVSDEDASDG